MSQYINPIVPGERRYPTITPFTYRDGMTYQRTLDMLVRAMRELIDKVNEHGEELENLVIDILNEKIDEINVALSDQEASVDAKIEALESWVNSEVADIQQALTDQETSVDNKIVSLETWVNNQTTQLSDYVDDEVQTLTTYVDTKVDEILNSSVGVQDSVVSDLIEDDGTATRESLDGIYESKQSATSAHDAIQDSINEVDDRLTPKVGQNSTDINAINDVLEGRLSEENIRKIAENSILNPLIGASIAPGGCIILLGSSTTSHGVYADSLIGHMDGFIGRVRMQAKDDDSANDTFARAYNYGVSATTSADYISSSDLASINSKNPTMVIHGIGSNDWRQNVAPATYAQNVETAISSINSSNPLIHVIVHQHERMGSFTTSYEWEDYYNALVDTFSGRSDVFLVNAGEQFKKIGVYRGGDDRYGFLKEDKTHLTEPGGKLLAATVAELMGVSSQYSSGWIDLSPYATSGVTEANIIGKIQSGVVTISVARANADYQTNESFDILEDIPVMFRPYRQMWGAAWGAQGERRGGITVRPAGTVGIVPGGSWNNAQATCTYVL